MIEAPRHDLDEAIDRVAAKMVAVPGESRMLQQVIERLPERATSPWFLTVPGQLAVGAALVWIAFVWARPSDPQEMPIALAPVAATAPPLVTARLVEPASFRPIVRIPDPESRIPAMTIDRPDHERSLAPVEALMALELGSIAAPVLEPEAAVVFAPLVLSELVLASDSSSPR